ncbi:MAG: excinuclease ABC subunit UvrC [Aeromonas sp.]
MPSTAFDSHAFLATLTHQSGVYRMLDSAQTVIYVGKAKDLKKRLSSYFRAKVDSVKTQRLVQRIAQIEVTVTHTETEALILEHNLIKQYQPRYNVLLRDDKTYPFILITDQRHPRIGVHRGPRKCKGDYFGPYPSGGAVRESLHLLQKIFPVRQCEDAVYANRSRPCLLYQLGRCAGPCVTGLVSDEAYAQQVSLAKLFLSGKNQQVIAQLVEKMEVASAALDFEQAAKLRDQILLLRKVSEQQWVSGDVQGDLDVIGLAYQAGGACVHVLFIRQGQVLGSRSYFPKVPSDTPLNEVLETFVLQFYLHGMSGRQLPHELLLGHGLNDETVIAATLSQSAGRQVRVVSRVRGDRARFIKLATTNAHTALASQQAARSHQEARVRALEQVLELTTPIARMECFDISHTLGERTVASCVVFDRQGPASRLYRRFNIEGITGGDDYAAMAQVLTRRFNKAQAPEEVPDVLFVDGGLGQLARAEEIMAAQAANLGGKVPLLVGVAKGVTRKAGLETLILGGSHETLHLPSDQAALHLIQHIRDESHRFAITGHRARREKARTHSQLEEIDGVGPKRRQALLKFLGGWQEVKKASVDELMQVPGISKTLAEHIFAVLRSR